MATPKTSPTPEAVLGNEKETSSLVSPKETELREENKRLLDSITKIQTRRDELGNQVVKQQGIIEKLTADLENERSISDTVQEGDGNLPTMKEIYLQVVLALAPGTALGTDKLSDDTIKKVAEHAVGVSQYFFAATRRKFHAKH
jgi:hypothetical protein